MPRVVLVDRAATAALASSSSEREGGRANDVEKEKTEEAVQSALQPEKKAGLPDGIIQCQK